MIIKITKICVLVIFFVYANLSLASLNKYDEIKVKKGDTFAKILHKSEIENSDIYNAINEIEKLFNVTSLRIGANIKVFYKEPKNKDESNELIHIVVEKNKLENILVTKSADGVFKAEIQKIPTKTKLIKASGKIESSLFAATNKLNIPYSIGKDFVKKLSYDVDFQRDIRKGNNFELLYQIVVNDKNEILETGDIIYSSITIGNDKIKIYRHQNKDGDYQYFSENGESVEKSFLKTPVDGARLTSGYGMRRHPILGYNKMHKGLDFGAKTGAPVYAAGSGGIVKIGWFSSYGKYIKIKHPNGYETAYAHLNGYKKGLSKGSRVKQGDVIGYVGSTGRSTGPHLHYELIKNGRQINPLSVKTIATKKLKGLNLAIFKKYSEKIDKIMQKNSKYNKTEVILAKNDKN